MRNVLPIKINEVRFGTGANPTNQFIELYNASASAVDLSNWTLINTQSQWAPVKLATIPAGTKLASGAYYLLGLSSSGLAAPASAGATTINVRSTTGFEPARRSTSTARPARSPASGRRPRPMTTVFIPVSTGPWITIPAGSTNLPVTNAAGFAVGQKIGIDIGGNYELATVTAVGKAATQTTLSAAAAAGATNIKVAANANMTVGDTLTVGTGGRKELVKVASVGTTGASGTGVDLAAPLRFDHMSGVDVSDVGTGISFSPATKFPHMSGDAVQALGQRHHARQPAGQEPRVRRGRGQPAGHDGGLPGAAGAQSVVRRRALGQGRLDRAAGRQRRGGRRRHRLRIPAEQLERERNYHQPRDRHPRRRPGQGRLHRGGAHRGPRRRPGPRGRHGDQPERRPLPGRRSTPTASAPIS